MRVQVPRVAAFRTLLLHFALVFCICGPVSAHLVAMPSSSEEEEDDELTSEQRKLRKALIWARKCVARKARQKREAEAADKKWQQEAATTGTKWTKFHNSEKRKPRSEANRLDASKKGRGEDGADDTGTGATSKPAQKKKKLNGTEAERALLKARLTAFYAKHNPEKTPEEIAAGAGEFAGGKENKLNMGLRGAYDDDLDSFPASDFPAEFTALEEERAAEKAKKLKAQIDAVLLPTDNPFTLRGKLIAFYATHDPDKLCDVDTFVKKYATKAQLFIEAICTKYKIDVQKLELDAVKFYNDRRPGVTIVAAASTIAQDPEKLAEERKKRQEELERLRQQVRLPPNHAAQFQPAPAAHPFYGGAGFPPPHGAVPMPGQQAAPAFNPAVGYPYASGPPAAYGAPPYAGAPAAGTFPPQWQPPPQQ